MTKKEAFSVTAELSGRISAENPTYDFSSKEIRNFKKQYTDDEISALRSMGWLGDDFELFLVISQFMSDSGIFDTAEDSYITEVFKYARKFDVSEFYSDPYISTVKPSVVTKGNFRLTSASYSRGELFLYDAPDFSKDIIVPKIGFFTGKVTFPTIYEGSMPWMSVCPSEINSMKAQMDAAFGRVLVLGCGLGYYQLVVSNKPQVESVTIVEISPEVVEIFKEHILPYFPNKNKVEIVVADAVKFMETVKDGDFDFIFSDIWEGIVDGAKHYESIKPFEKLLPNTSFTYWIEPQIKYYISENSDNFGD